MNIPKTSFSKKLFIMVVVLLDISISKKIEK